MIPKKILENGGQLNLRLNTENKELSKQVKKKHQVLRILEKRTSYLFFFFFFCRQIANEKVSLTTPLTSET